MYRAAYSADDGRLIRQYTYDFKCITHESYSSPGWVVGDEEESIYDLVCDKPGNRGINGQPGLGTPIRAFACLHITDSSNLRQIFQHVLL
jgi:hypothetical protein